MEVPVEDGSFFVEINDDSVFEDAETKFGESLMGKFRGNSLIKMEKKDVKIEESIKYMIQYMYSSFESIPKPDELSLEFGVKVVAGTGGILSAALTKLEGEMQMTVKATWKNKPEKPEAFAAVG